MLQVLTQFSVFVVVMVLSALVCWVIIPIGARSIINGFFQEKFNFLNRISQLPGSSHQEKDRDSYRDSRIQ